MADEIVNLCLPAHLPAQEEGKPPVVHTEVVLKRGVSYGVFGREGAVKFTGEPNAFVNALSVLAAPTGVRVRSRDTQREVVLDGARVMATVPEHTAFLVDG